MFKLFRKLFSLFNRLLKQNPSCQPARSEQSPAHASASVEAHAVEGFTMPPGTPEEDPLPPRSENQGFRRNYFTFFGNPGTPNPSKFEISPKFCEFFSIPWNSARFSSKSARKHVKLIQNSQKMMKFGGKNCKNTNEKLTNIWVWSGAKEWESCRSRKMWKNAPTLAIVGTHTAENEPSKVLAEMGGPL